MRVGVAKRGATGAKVGGGDGSGSGLFRAVNLFRITTAEWARTQVRLGRRATGEGH